MIKFVSEGEIVGEEKSYYQLKTELENKIVNLCINFCRKTNLTISNIAIENRKVYGFEGCESPIQKVVKVDIQF